MGGGDAKPRTTVCLHDYLLVWVLFFLKKKKHHVVLVSAAEHAQEGEKGGSAWSSALKMKAEVGPVKAAAKLLL